MPSSVTQLSTSSKNDWLSACQALEQQGQPYCIVTIIAEAGSLPRGTGSKIVITQSQQFDTLGGGQLEFEIINTARKGLKEKQSTMDAPLVHIERFSLVADLGQCCGGACAGDV
ncbi:XdhC family protein [Psychromonas sp. KJ10-10]|uniref:XdhC family protein n=1 Tax=Psychromonas sp. KJ10-10 TaxID=3391823 RepID=UPI0039B42A91